MRMKFTKSVSVLLAVIMALSVMSIAVFAADDSVTVTFSAFDGSVIVPMEEISVKDGTAEEYGYTVSSADHNGVAINGVTAFDVLVAAHKAYYGDAFTAETASSYLRISYGYVSYAFGKSATASSFAVNDAMPTDGIYNPSYGSATSYTFDSARMNSGDVLSFFFYQDTQYYSDYYSWLKEDSADGYTVNYTLSGYSYMYYGYMSDVSEYVEVLPGVDVYILDSNDEYTKVGTTDENGQISVTFPGDGDYRVCAYGVLADDYGDTPVAAAWAAKSFKSKSKTLWEKFVDFIHRIINFFKKLFNR